uniref:Uncharacterized protein n=1 Tax=Tanacetum cinerariifolium TaxID=118510 RepID=A0A699IWA6_TANCI|nr:hypothetical protein [Tanacetum cinerariifolium]
MRRIEEEAWRLAFIRERLIPDGATHATMIDGYYKSKKIDGHQIPTVHQVIKVQTICGCGNGVLRSVVHVAPTVTKLTIEYIKGHSEDFWMSLKCLGTHHTMVRF